MRSVRPELVAEFAAGHDQGMWQCLQTVLNIPEESALTRAIISFPFSLGGLGLRSATSLSAWWASKADTLPMIHARHPDVGMMILNGLNHEAQGPNVRGVADTVRMLTGEGLSRPVGRHSWTGHAHHRTIRRIMSQVEPEEVGNMKLHLELNRTSETGG